MNLEQFTESDHCLLRLAGENGLSCHVCRSSKHYRRSVAKHFLLPDNNINFPCPHGVPWIVPPGTPAIVKPQKLPTGPGDVMRTIIKSLYGQGQIKNCACGKVQRWMNKQGWLWCLTHKTEVFDRIKESAKRMGFILDAHTFWQAHREMRRKMRSA